MPPLPFSLQAPTNLTLKLEIFVKIIIFRYKSTILWNVLLMISKVLVQYTRESR